MKKLSDEQIIQEYVYLGVLKQEQADRLIAYFKTEKPRVKIHPAMILQKKEVFDA